MTMTHCAKVLAVLADGKAHTTSDLYRQCGGMILHSRIAELRKRGHNIVCERVPHAQGANAYKYTWVDAPPQKPVQTRKGREYTERYDPRQRYRPYKVGTDGDLEWIAGAGVDNEAAIVTMLIILAADGEYDPDAKVGVLDTEQWRLGKSGTWIINAYKD